MKIVESEFKGGRYLRYALLNRLFETLIPEEQEQLTDYIIQLYFCFDREACCQLFESLQQMAATYFRQRTAASEVQIARFLHLKRER